VDSVFLMASYDSQESSFAQVFGVHYVAAQQEFRAIKAACITLIPCCALLLLLLLLLTLLLLLLTPLLLLLTRLLLLLCYTTISGAWQSWCQIMLPIYQPATWQLLWVFWRV
jgi:hypothetical protein